MRRRAVVAGVACVLPFLLAGWVSPHDPLEQHREYAAVGPRCGEPCFLLGTDGFGRDVLSRVLHGGRVSLLAGMGAAAIALAVGGLLGTVAGSLRGWADAMVSRPVELLFTLPWLYVLLAARAALPLTMEAERVLYVTMGIVGLAGAGAPFRMARQSVIAARDGEAVRAAAGLGAGRWHIFRRHLLPAAYGPLAALGVVLAPQFTLAEVSLSFLGLGAGEPAVSWGSMLAELREYPALTRQWWLWAPAAALTVVTGVMSGVRR